MEKCLLPSWAIPLQATNLAGRIYAKREFLSMLAG